MINDILTIYRYILYSAMAVQGLFVPGILAGAEDISTTIFLLALLSLVAMSYGAKKLEVLDL